MQYQTIAITYTRKINLGNYESVEASAYLSSKIDENDPVKDVIDSLVYTAKNSVYKALESEMSSETKVILKGKICGKEFAEDVVSVSKDEKNTSLNSSVLNKLKEEDDMLIEFDNEECLF